MKLYVRDKRFYKNVADFAIPITLLCLISVGVNMMDNIMVGSLGDDSLSAVSLANQFINIFSLACMGLGQGTSVMCSRYYGMKDNEALKKTISIAFRYCLVLTVLFTFVSIFFPARIMRIYIADSGVISEGVKYFGFSAYCYFFFGLSLITANALRSIGKVRVPLVTATAAFVVNIFFNYVFIFGKFGFPAMGVAGAALGTFLSRIVEFSINCGYLFFGNKEVGYKISDITKTSPVISHEFKKIAIPVMLSDTLNGFGMNLIAMITGRVGKEFVSAYSITAVVMQTCSVLTQGLAQASSIITGHTLGTGDVERTKREADAFFGLSLAFGFIGAIVILIVAKPIVSLYNISDAARLIAMELMSAISVVAFFKSIDGVLTKGVLRGGGDTRFLMVADMIFLWVASVPLGYFVGLVLKAPAFFTYVALSIDVVLKCFLCFYRLRSGKWIKKIMAK